MNRTTLFWAGGGLALAASCGARSSLDAAASAASSGSGGEPSAQSASSSGSGGGETFDRCPAAQVAAPVLTLEDLGDLRRPSLTVIAGESPAAAVVYSRQLPSEGPTLRVAAFPGWGPWPPPPIAPVDVSSSDGSTVPGVSFLAASGGVSGASVALLFRAEDPFVSALSTQGDPASGSLSDPVFKPQGGEALDLAPDAAREQYAGVLGRHDPNDDYTLDFFFSYPGGATYRQRVACTTTPSAGAALWGPHGWIAGVASGGPFGFEPSLNYPCSAKLLQYGAATSLQFAVVSSLGEVASAGFSGIDEGNVISRVKLAPRGDGAFAVWSTEGSPSLHGAVLDEWANIAERFTISPTLGEVVAGSFAVERVGEDLLVAVAVALGDGSRGIEVSRFDEKASVKWTALIPMEGALENDGGRPISLVASPAGDAYLVSWAESSAGAPERRVVRIARVDCLLRP